MDDSGTEHRYRGLMAGRFVPPARWEQYHLALHKGHSSAHAARLAGISENTARTFEQERRLERRGIVSARSSSGWAWLDWRRATEEPDPRIATEKASA